jgi:hypothetical protein
MSEALREGAEDSDVGGAVNDLSLSLVGGVDV